MVTPFPEIQKQALFGGGTKGASGIDDPRPGSLHAKGGCLICFQHDFAIAVERE